MKPELNFPYEARKERKVKMKVNDDADDPEYGRYVRRDVVILAAICLVSLVGIIAAAWIRVKYF